MQQAPPPGSGRWTTGLFGCFEDIETCCCGWCCPCVLFGRYAEILDQGATSCCVAGTMWAALQACTGWACILSCGYRSRLRHKYGLPSNACGDFLTECCCLNCSICQVYRELKNRNIDPTLGYEGVRHIYEQPAQPAPYPPGNQFMSK